MIFDRAYPHGLFLEHLGLMAPSRDPGPPTTLVYMGSGHGKSFAAVEIKIVGAPGLRVYRHVDITFKCWARMSIQVSPT